MAYHHTNVVGSRRNSVDRHRKYAAPPSQGNAKDDLHEWSIYRQNLTSTIAEGLLSGLVPQSQTEGITSVRSSTRGRGAAPNTQLPYGDFQMHDNAVESVLSRRRRQDPYLGEKGHVYLRFGLPRVELANDSGKCSMARMGGLDYKNRKSHSEMDIRRAVLDAPATRGPYHVQASGSVDWINLVGTRPVQKPSFDYAQSEIAVDRISEWRSSARPIRTTAMRASQRSHLRAPLPSLVIDGPSTPRSIPTVGPRTHFSTSSRAPKGTSASGHFLHGERHHHGHYFSNLDLFTGSTAYNYLRYAKADELQGPVGKYPHLQLRHVSFDVDCRSKLDRAMLRTPRYRSVLDGISFEVFGGETMAIMYTSKDEVTSLLSLLANAHCLKGRMDGSILLNGLPMSGKILGDRISYVCDHDLNPLLTVKEHLRLQCAFVKPANDLFPTSSMVANLIETLALAPFQDSLISDLRTTEKRRVKLACQILLDAAVLLASGRIIFFGQTHTMINYFESLSYPCPLFKNPCDYFVDLVTHDYLTVEVAMESSERIRRLSESWAQRAPPLTEPNPIGLAPPRFRYSNPFTAAVWIYYRFWLIFMNHPWEYARECFYCLLLSTSAGAIFYQLTTSKQAGINDRFVHSERNMTFNDALHNLYPAVSYIAAKLLFELPLVLVAYTLYSIPVHIMAQLQHWSQDAGRGFAIYVGFSILYYFSTRMLAWASAYLFKGKAIAAIFTGAFMIFFSINAGVTLHPNDRWQVLGDWPRYISPTQWILQIFAEHELLGNSTGLHSLRQNSRRLSTMLEFECEAREIKLGPIVTTGQCPTANGIEALSFANLTVRGLASAQNSTYYIGASVITGLALLCKAVACFAASLRFYQPKVKKKRREN